MANVTTAFGLRPVRHINGSPWNGATETAYISSLYAVALFIGDPILWTPTLAEKDALALYPTINVSAGTDGVIIYGVITSFDVKDGVSVVYNKASTERYCQICTDPTVVYHVRGDGGATPTSVFVGQNANMIASAAGSTVTGISGYHLDEGTTDAPEANQTNPLLILGLADLPDNELGKNAVWEVLLNTQENATGKYLGVTAA